MEKQFLKNRFETIKEFVFNYPDGDNSSSWLTLFGDWIKKHRTQLYTKSNKVIATTYIMQVVKSFNSLMLNDILFNHTIFAFPGNKVFMFIAQVPENSKYKKVFFNTGMYNLRVCLYFISTTRKRAQFKYIYPMGVFKNDISRALNQGHKYPRQEDVITFINSQVYG